MSSTSKIDLFFAIVIVVAIDEMSLIDYDYEYDNFV